LWCTVEGVCGAHFTTLSTVLACAWCFVLLQALFRRAQLKALVGLHGSAEGLGGNLSLDEISIITGALDLTSKTACTAMTPLEKVGSR
jgi:hypothetical protein